MTQLFPPNASPPANRNRNRSLERGLEILRAFRPGTDLLGNGEVAERTGLSKATVSRLCQTLADAGFLERDHSARAYRLAAPVLSLAHAMRTGSPVLAMAGPLMRAEAEKRKINVGMAVPDRDEMVYLESIRYGRKVAWRNVVAGQRVPTELTSLGRVWLAIAPEPQRDVLMAQFKARRSHSDWSLLEREIEKARLDVGRRGFCWASWQPEVVALAAPVRAAGHPLPYVLNMSVASVETPAAVVDRLAQPLLKLATRLEGLLASTAS